MKTDVLIAHHDYPAHVREHVTEKLEGLDRFFEGTVSVRARLHREHDLDVVELVANVRRGVVLVTEGRSDRLSAALDDAVVKMGRALAKHKEKVKLVPRKEKGRPDRRARARA